MAKAPVLQVEQIFDSGTNPTIQDPLFSKAYGEDRPAPAAPAAAPVIPGQLEIPDQPGPRITPGPGVPAEAKETRKRPPLEDRLARAARRQEAADAEAMFTDALFAARPDLADGRIKAPPPRERIAKRFGGGTRDVTSGSYDWFYELDPAEQSRIRQNWMVTDEGVEAGAGRRRGMTPDEIEEAGLPMGEWLALTRGIDAARAVQTGREVSPKRYGGRDPYAYLKRARPEDEGSRVDGFTDRQGRRREIDGNDRVQFFTDENGVVHPIRATYETPQAPQPRSSYLNAYGERVERRAPSYDPDEAF